MAKSQPKKSPIVVVLDNVRSFYNVGAIFRTCDGAGVDKLFLMGITGYPTHSKRAQRQITKTALGTIQSVEWEYNAETFKTLASLKAQGNQIIALEKTAKSKNYQLARYQFPLALVVGHETLGVSKEALKLADQFVHIPMHGRAKSLNVATATGIMLFYLRSILDRNL